MILTFYLHYDGSKRCFFLSCQYRYLNIKKILTHSLYLARTSRPFIHSSHITHIDTSLSLYLNPRYCSCGDFSLCHFYLYIGWRSTFFLSFWFIVVVLFVIIPVCILVVLSSNDEKSTKYLRKRLLCLKIFFISSGSIVLLSDWFL